MMTETVEKPISRVTAAEVRVAFTIEREHGEERALLRLPALGDGPAVYRPSFHVWTRRVSIPPVRNASEWTDDGGQRPREGGPCLG